jgi:hypothetical protein
VARGSRGQDRAVISHQAPQTEAVGLPEQSWPLMRSQVVWVEEGEETLSRARPARSTPVHLKAGRLRVRMRGLMVTAWCRARAGQPPLELAWLGGSGPSKRWAAWEIADAETSATQAHRHVLVTFDDTISTVKPALRREESWEPGERKAGKPGWLAGDRDLKLAAVL